MKKYDTWTILLIIIVVIIIAPHILKFLFSVAFIVLFSGIILFILKKYVSKKEYDNKNRYSKMERIFMNGEVKTTKLYNKYEFIFSNAILNCTEFTVPLQDENIKIDIAFSKCIIKLNHKIPAIIRMDSSFSSVTMPDNTRITFGEESYFTRAYKRGVPSLNIEVDVTFSNVEIIEM